MTPDVRDLRLAVDELNARFAWALDTPAFDELREVMRPDVHYVGSNGEFTDLDSVINAFKQRTGDRVTRHGVSNLLLTRIDQQRALGRSTWHTFASNDPQRSGIGMSMVADFHDCYERDSTGRWWIAQRLIKPVFREPRLAPGAPARQGSER